MQNEWVYHESRLKEYNTWRAIKKAFAIIPVDGREMNVSDRPTSQAYPLSIGYANKEGLRSMLQLLLM